MLVQALLVSTSARGCALWSRAKAILPVLQPHLLVLWMSCFVLSITFLLMSGIGLVAMSSWRPFACQDQWSFRREMSVRCLRLDITWPSSHRGTTFLRVFDKIIKQTIYTTKGTHNGKTLSTCSKCRGVCLPTPSVAASKPHVLGWLLISAGPMRLCCERSSSSCAADATGCCTRHEVKSAHRSASVPTKSYYNWKRQSRRGPATFAGSVPFCNLHKTRPSLEAYLEEDDTFAGRPLTAESCTAGAS